MTQPRGDDDWFPGTPEADDRDGDSRSTFAVAVGSIGAVVVAAAMALAIVFAFGDGAETSSTVLPPPGADATADEESVASPDPTSSPTTTPATPPSPTPTAPEASLHFVSPSGNIACVVTQSRAECHIAAYEYEPPEAGECATAWGDAVAVTADAADWVCHDGSFEPGGEPLPYGSGAGVGGFTCRSAEDGVTCTHDPSGASFRISRGGVDLP